MISDRNRIYDGWVRMEAGVDAGRAPNLIELNQAAGAENMTFRGGKPSVRPGFRQLTETFTNPTHGFDARGVEIPPGNPVTPPAYARTAYKQHVFQTALCYSPHKGGDCIMALIGGRLFKIIPMINSAKVTEITVQDARSPYISQGVRNLLGGVTRVPLNILSIDPNHPPNNPSRFMPTDVGATVFSDNYLNGYTIITHFFNDLSVRTAWDANNPETDFPFTIRHNFEHAAYRNYQWSPIAYMVQADKWLIAQDGLSKPIVFDSSVARRSYVAGDASNLEVPVGTMMAYGMGRIVVVVNERDVAFGDLYGSHLDTRPKDPGDSIILFTERNFLAGGFDAAIPFQQGVATGIQFFPQLDTSTGNGQLLVFAERGAASFNMAIDRTLWQTSQFQILALLTTGMRGHRSIAAVNEDLWFRGDDGFRSFRQARSDSWGWAHIPLSTNLGQFLDLDDGELLKFASTIYFDNRVIGTTSPVWNVDPVNAPRGRVYHNGLVVVDFDVLSTFGTKYKPTWEGHWTIGNVFTSNLPDIKISQLLTGTFNGVTRAFCFGIDQTGQNQLYELSFDDKDDFCGSIPFELVSRSFDFKGGGQQSNEFTENELYDGDMWINEISEGGITPEPPPPPP